jgi:hypothetical protein
VFDLLNFVLDEMVFSTIVGVRLDSKLLLVFFMSGLGTPETVLKGDGGLVMCAPVFLLVVVLLFGVYRCPRLVLLLLHLFGAWLVGVAFSWLFRAALLLLLCCCFFSSVAFCFVLFVTLVAASVGCIFSFLCLPCIFVFLPL